MNATEIAELRMNAYYYSFTPTGNEAIDRILSAVACAGKASHHTDSWGDETYARVPPSGHLGKSPVEWIQNAANAACNALDRAEDYLAACRSELGIDARRAERAEKALAEYQREVERRDELLAKDRDAWMEVARQHEERAEKAERALAEERSRAKRRGEIDEERMLDAVAIADAGARRDEREECARLVDPTDRHPRTTEHAVRTQLANAIRARGLDAKAEDHDRMPRQPGCKCHLEEGDSPCPVHCDGECGCSPLPTPDQEREAKTADLDDVNTVRAAPGAAAQYIAELRAELARVTAERDEAEEKLGAAQTDFADALGKMKRDLATAEAKLAEADALLRAPCDQVGCDHDLARRLAAAEAKLAEAEHFRPTPANINALPMPLRQYIHDLETRCDPAGDVQTMTALRENVEALALKLAEEEGRSMMPVRLRERLATAEAPNTDCPKCTEGPMESYCACCGYGLSSSGHWLSKEAEARLRNIIRSEVPTDAQHEAFALLDKAGR